MYTIFERLFYFASGEWLLRKRANGGTIIVARSLLSAAVIYLIAIALSSRLGLGDVSTVLSLDAFLKEAGELLPWFGALFAAVYAGLYARFSSQWAYLADLYNQIMAAQIQTPVEDKNRETYNKWFVGFIDDAETLHLALKPTFASVIASMLEKKGVAELYAASGSTEHLASLQAAITRVLEGETGRPLKPISRPDA